MSKVKQVLVVDDSAELAQVIADFLGMFGYEVRTARNGLDALEVMDDRGMDLVVTDIHMPRMDGLKLMTEIKSRFPGTPVVLITGFSVGEARQIAFERGADAFVAKPFHLKDLKDVIDSVCN